MASGCSGEKQGRSKAGTCRREKVSPIWHAGAYCLTVSADGKRLFAGGFKSITEYDVDTGKKVRTLSGILPLQIKPRSIVGRQASLLISDRDKTIKVWDRKKVKCCSTCRGMRTVCFPWLYPMTTSVSTPQCDTTIKKWEVAKCKDVLTLPGHEGRVTSLILSGNRLFSASTDESIKVWNAATGKEILTLRGHYEAVYRLALSADRKVSRSASADKTIKVWFLETFKLP